MVGDNGRKLFMGAGGFKDAVLRSKTNSLKGNSSSFESSLLANCVGHDAVKMGGSMQKWGEVRRFADCTNLQPSR